MLWFFSSPFLPRWLAITMPLVKDMGCILGL
jgi:hypothetical protein